MKFQKLAQTVIFKRSMGGKGELNYLPIVLSGSRFTERAFSPLGKVLKILVRLWHDTVYTTELEREKLVVLICWQPVQAGKAACTRPRT